MKRIAAIALVAAFSAPPVLAQEAVEDVIVTGSRASDWDPDRAPVVQLPRRADNLIVGVRVVNDTRSPADRRAEITQTLRAMARSASARNDIDLAIEDDGVLVPLTEDMMATLSLGADGNRADTSVASLVVKTPIQSNDTLDSASGRIERFVEDAPQAGRSLVEIKGSWELSILNPPQYRPAILQAIAADARTTAAAFGENYAVQVEGLSNRVAWRQSGPLELNLFIPYEMTVEPRR
ncbi:MAG: hypothetical protein EON88_18460 [Brevundimonas sp.]|nr:MAG: hypothetical protein EON88_18460 [Brevundimonas sp.]